MKTTIFFFLFIFSAYSFSQTFELSDTTYDIGDIYRTRSIFFYFNKSDINLEASKPTLDSIKAFLTTNESITIEIGCHTDYVPPEYSTSLTHKRAQFLFNYLIEKGIQSERLKYTGYGASQPITDNSTAELKQLNRRVELKILSSPLRTFELTDSTFQIGHVYRTHDIFFHVSKSGIYLKASEPELKRMLSFLNDNKTICVEIGYHKDNSGSEAYSFDLTHHRAQSIVDYLISKEIDKKRLSFKGYGESEPLNDNSTPALRQVNRRTEMKITSI